MSIAYWKALKNGILVFAVALLTLSPTTQSVAEVDCDLSPLRVREDLKTLVKAMFDGAPNRWHSTGFKGPTSSASRWYQRGLTGYSGPETDTRDGAAEALELLAGKKTKLERYAYTSSNGVQGAYTLASNRSYARPLVIFGRTENFWQGRIDFSGMLVLKEGNSIETVERIGIFTIAGTDADFSQGSNDYLLRLAKYVLSWSNDYFKLRNTVLASDIVLAENGAGARFTKELHELTDFVQSHMPELSATYSRASEELFLRIQGFLKKWDPPTP